MGKNCGTTGGSAGSNSPRYTRRDPRCSVDLAFCVVVHRQAQRCSAMYASSLRRAGTATRPRHSRRVRPLGSGRPRPLAQQKGHASTVAAAEAGGGANGEAWTSGRSKLAGWRAPSVAGAVALVPVIGGAWLVTVYALRQRLCEHHLQQVGAYGERVSPKTTLVRACCGASRLVYHRGGLARCVARGS